MSSLSPPELVLRTYFHAKDENRPHLLDRVFARDAELEVLNRTDTISFPAQTVGLREITAVLVRDFDRRYENVYSFYLSRPAADAPTFSCGWLVAMSEKDSRSTRVGCGRYDWVFGSTTPLLATRLRITIETMQLLAPERLDTALDWVGNLEYPWSSAGAAIAAAPEHEDFAPIVRRLESYVQDA